MGQPKLKSSIQWWSRTEFILHRSHCAITYNWSPECVHCTLMDTYTSHNSFFFSFLFFFFSTLLYAAVYTDRIISGIWCLYLCCLCVSSLLHGGHIRADHMNCGCMWCDESENRPETVHIFFSVLFFIVYSRISSFFKLFLFSSCVRVLLMLLLLLLCVVLFKYFKWNDTYIYFVFPYECSALGYQPLCPFLFRLLIISLYNKIQINVCVPELHV